MQAFANWQANSDRRPAPTDWRGGIGDAPPLCGGSEHQGRLGVDDENVQAEKALHSKSNLLAMSCPTPGLSANVFVSGFR